MKGSKFLRVYLVVYYINLFFKRSYFGEIKVASIAFLLILISSYKNWVIPIN